MTHDSLRKVYQKWAVLLKQIEATPKKDLLWNKASKYMSTIQQISWIQIKLEEILLHD